MNTGQMLLVLGALMILGIVTLTVNSMLASKTQTMLNAEADLMAVSIAQSMIDEAMTASYDKLVVADSVKIFNDSSQFTPSANLGPEGSEAILVPLPEPPDTSGAYKSVKYYNDFDDYNGYRRYVYTSMGVFAVCDTVYYVTEYNPDQYSSAQTFHKKIVVTVRHPNLVPPGQGYSPWDGPGYFQLSDVAVYRRYF